MYAAMARHWLRGNDTLLIVLDWSDLNESRSAQMIRASVALNGRSLTLYEQGHSMKAATKPEVHKAFLARLKMMLAPGCQPIVMTDAGFRSPWFRAVEAHGWRGVGWGGTQPKPRSGAQPRPSFCAVVRLLGASVSLAHLSAQAIVAIYAQRMQIERAFRDTKNARFGLGLRNSASRTPARLAESALIASLAEFVLRLIGQCAINHHLQYDLQLTNRKKRPQISVIRVGILLVNCALGAFSAAEFRRTMKAWAAPHHALQL